MSSSFQSSVWKKETTEIKGTTQIIECAYPFVQIIASIFFSGPLPIVSSAPFSFVLIPRGRCGEDRGARGARFCWKRVKSSCSDPFCLVLLLLLLPFVLLSLFFTIAQHNKAKKLEETNGSERDIALGIGCCVVCLRLSRRGRRGAEKKMLVQPRSSREEITRCDALVVQNKAAKRVPRLVHELGRIGR